RLRWLQQAGEEPLKAVGVARYHGGLRIALARREAEGGIEVHQHQPRGGDALRDQRLGDRAGAGTELDDRTRHGRIDIARHGAGERAAGGRHRPGGQRLLDPAADEAHLVVEADAVLLLEAPDLNLELLLMRFEFLLEPLPMRLKLPLDPLLNRAFLLLEQLDVKPDSSFQLALLQLEQPLLLLEFPFEELQGWKRHRGGNAKQ